MRPPPSWRPPWARATLLTGRGADDLAVPPPPAGGPCVLRKEGLAHVPTYERASARSRRGWWGGCLFTRWGALVTSPRRRLDVRTLGMQIGGGSEASEGGAVQRPLEGAWPEAYSRRTDVITSCVILRTESASLPIGGACLVPIKSNTAGGRLPPRLARSPGVGRVSA